MMPLRRCVCCTPIVVPREYLGPVGNKNRENPRDETPASSMGLERWREGKQPRAPTTRATRGPLQYYLLTICIAVIFISIS